jgi:hypothetical protein
MGFVCGLGSGVWARESGFLKFGQVGKGDSAAFEKKVLPKGELNHETSKSKVKDL